MNAFTKHLYESSYMQGTKFPIFRSKYQRNFGYRWRSIRYLHQNFVFPIFPDFFRYFPKIFDFSLGSKNLKKKKCFWRVFEPTQNACKWHPPTTKPLIALIIYSANFFFILFYYLFVHNPYHHMIIIFYFIFILHYNL